MPTGSLRIAWLGAVPGRGDSGGVPGVATELLHGLAGRRVAEVLCDLLVGSRPVERDELA